MGSAMKMVSAGMVLLVLAGATALRAADRYALEAPGAVMAGDAFELKVIPRSGAGRDGAPQRVKLEFPAGFIAAGAPRFLDLQGEGVVSVKTLPTVAPGLYALSVRSAGDRRVLGMVDIAVERPAASFSLVPLRRPFVGEVGKPFEVQVVARDDRGGAVTSFHGDVNLNAAVGSVSPAVLSGEHFHEGIAVLSVTLTATNPADRRNRLEAVSRKIVEGQAAPARGGVDLTIKQVEGAR